MAIFIVHFGLVHKTLSQNLEKTFNGIQLPLRIQTIVLPSQLAAPRHPPKQDGKEVLCACAYPAAKLFRGVIFHIELSLIRWKVVLLAMLEGRIDNDTDSVLLFA
jgi:hypothetical protein